MDERPKLTASDAKQYLKVVKSRLTSEKYAEFHGIMKDYREHSIDIPGVKTKLVKLFNGDRKLLLGLNIFLPKESRIILAREDEPCDVVKQFVHHIKTELQDDHLYIFFLGALDLYRMGKISANEVQKKVAHLFKDHPELIKDFTNFLPYCYAYSIEDKNAHNEHWSSPLQCKEETIASHAEHGEVAGQPDSDHEKSPAMTTKEPPRCPEKRKRKRSTTGGKLILGSKRSLVSSKGKKKRRIREASQRTEMDKEVLNDHWVSVNYASDGHPFKPAFKNPYEQSLFKLEDDRFEMDMGLERIKFTIKQAEELMKKIHDRSIKKHGPSLRCIEMIYGDHGLDMVDELRKNLSCSLPIVLIRLKQKQREWMKFRTKLNKLSRKAFAENHQRSLDHHGFYLKEQDSKSLSAKALLAEIDEISEARLKEDMPHQLPHMEFKFSDMDIHEDLFQLIKLYSPEICSPEQLDKVLKIWTDFVGAMFGLPPRSGCLNNQKHIAKTSPHATKNGPSVIKEDGQIVIYSESINPDNYLEFMIDEIESSPIVDLEKGGFAACMDDRMEQPHRPNDVNKPNCDNRHVEGVSGNEAEAYNIHFFYGDDAFYIFIRIYQALYSRLQEAKQSACEKWRGLNDITPKDSYAIFLDLLHNFLANREKDEDECQSSFFTWSGLIFSIERLINKLSRQLLAIAMDEVDNKLLDLFSHEKLRESGKFVEEVYTKNASMIVNDYKMFRFEHLLVPDTEGENRLTISQINVGERYLGYLVIIGISFKLSAMSNFPVFMSSDEIISLQELKRIVVSAEIL
ncbi:hypothetical protein L2E82_08916 [Cichorium intybus]|uniref:Uncharacterized protein n=1 Tax=Cichorium intybus TaxID=13427 RepID=A0ACB9G7T3_CICIN|nr:hypothetical protein L2E82_08916 [Cichorium intybus]